MRESHTYMSKELFGTPGIYAWELDKALKDSQQEMLP